MSVSCNFVDCIVLCNSLMCCNSAAAGVHDCNSKYLWSFEMAENTRHASTNLCLGTWMCRHSYAMVGILVICPVRKFILTCWKKYCWVWLTVPSFLAVIDRMISMCLVSKDMLYRKAVLIYPVVFFLWVLTIPCLNLHVLELSIMSPSWFWEPWLCIKTFGRQPQWY